MSPDHIGEPNEMIGLRPAAVGHFGGFTKMAGRSRVRDDAPRSPGCSLPKVGRGIVAEPCRPNTLLKGAPA